MEQEKKRILIIDDEPDLCEILRFNLSSTDYQVETAYDASEALAKDLTQFDLLLLDVMMPGMSGFELAHRLRENERTASIPIIFLTALGAEPDVLHGFDLGADDYIAKPFSIKEVQARIKAVLSRTGTDSSAREQAVLQYEGLKMDLSRMTVTVDGQPVSLTRTEFDLLHLLLGNRGRVFSRQEVLDKVWPRDVVVTDRTVDVNITRMRKKIGRYSSCIITRHGFGYLFIV